MLMSRAATDAEPLKREGRDEENKMVMREMSFLWLQLDCVMFVF